MGLEPPRVVPSPQRRISDQGVLVTHAIPKSRLKRAVFTVRRALPGWLGRHRVERKSDHISQHGLLLMLLIALFKALEAASEAYVAYKGHQ